MVGSDFRNVSAFDLSVVVMAFSIAMSSLNSPSGMIKGWP